MFVRLGGLDQWISTRGHDLTNPVLLFVHGGPGESQWPQADRLRGWEKSFTLVQWDQRGTGHTYGRYGRRTPKVSLEQISDDGVELASVLRRKLGKERIVVLGHSWGSIVATRMVQKRPGAFAAYVGTGQVASWSETVHVQFDLLLARARRVGDRETVEELEAIGRPDPEDARQYFRFSPKLRSLVWPRKDRAWLEHLQRQASDLRTSGSRRFQDLTEGMEFSAQRLLSDQMSCDLVKSAHEIQTAYFVIQGQEDVVTPTEAAVRYFRRVRAPVKALKLLPRAGHFAYATAPDRFLRAMNSKVRPVAIRRGA